MLHTRPDVAYIVSITSIYKSNLEFGFKNYKNSAEICC